MKSVIAIISLSLSATAALASGTLSVTACSSDSVTYSYTASSTTNLGIVGSIGNNAVLKKLSVASVTDATYDFAGDDGALSTNVGMSFVLYYDGGTVSASCPE